jgi:hypothetical protein
MALIAHLFYRHTDFFRKDRLMMVTLIAATLISMGAIFLGLSSFLIFQIIGITGSITNGVLMLMLGKTL